GASPSRRHGRLKPELDPRHQAVEVQAVAEVVAGRLEVVVLHPLDERRQRQRVEPGPDIISGGDADAVVGAVPADAQLQLEDGDDARLADVGAGDEAAEDVALLVGGGEAAGEEVEGAAGVAVEAARDPVFPFEADARAAAVKAGASLDAIGAED